MPRSTSSASRTTRTSRCRLGRDLLQQRAGERLVPLDLSSRRRRPDRGVPCANSASITPAASGSSALTIATSISRSRANATTAAGSHTSPTRARRRRRRRGARSLGFVADERVQLAVLRHTQRQRALAPAVADDHRSHAAQSRDARAVSERAQCLGSPARQAPVCGRGSQTAPHGPHPHLLSHRRHRPLGRLLRSARLQGDRAHPDQR